MDGKTPTMAEDPENTGGLAAIEAGPVRREDHGKRVEIATQAPVPCQPMGETTGRPNEEGGLPAPL
ncbi:MAG: hypothetical protein IAE87_16510 [Rhodobacteraceae bacterium]|nr:hypothetical protein [Paracoccaceae bacterium]